ncbi:MAG: DUF4153 domain-containing protein [Dermatophilaceae bacterium]
MSTDRPLDAVASIRVKLGLLVAASVLAALLVAAIGDSAGVPLWMSAPVTLAAALAVTLWLARGMTSPLREMTAAAEAMAAGDYTRRVRVTSSDEVGALGRAFNGMAADLATADQQRRELVATVSHELRTPLTAQRALLENLVDGVVRPDDDVLRAALHQSERLSALVTDLLELSRIDAGVVPLRLGEVEVSALLRRAADESAVGGGEVAVVPSVSPAGLTVQADPDRLAQLVANLVDNAVRHSPPGGTVRLDARALDDDDGWSLEVCDEGPGIPAERAEQVFDRFGGGDDASGGTGLGLAIASWVCTLHGGSIGVVPTPPGASGATLRAILPLTPPARAWAAARHDARDIHHDRSHPTQEVSPVASTSTPPPVPALAEPVASATPPGVTPPGGLVPPGLPTSSPPPVPAGPPRASMSPYVTNPYLTSPYGGGPGLVERIWPEPDRRPRPAVVLAALAVGGFAALTWVDRSFGLATALTMLAAGGLMWAVARHRSHSWTVLCGVLAALLVTVVVVRDAGGVVTLAVLAGVTVAAVGLTRAHGLLAMVASVAAWPLSALRGLPLLGRTVTAAGRMSNVWPVLRTLGISVVVLTVFGGLFATGDAVFGSWAEAVVPDLGWDTIVARTFLFVLVAGVALTGAYLAINPPAVDMVRMPDGARSRRVWEWAVPVGVVVALFGAFLVAQATAMWGGRDYLRRATGLTYAEYVHQGFGQLTAATFLTVLVVAVTVRVASVATPRDRAVLRGILGVLCVFTLAVVASALYRMSLYQEAFGYTVLRVFVDGFELWLGLVVVLVLAGVVRLSWRGVPRVVLVSGAVFTLGFAAMNPDAWVAGRNIDRFEAGKSLDTEYLAGLSADAAPVIAERLPTKVAGCVFGQSELGWGEEDDLLEWNLGRARGASAAATVPPPPTTADRPPSTRCLEVLNTQYLPN